MAEPARASGPAGTEGSVCPHAAAGPTGSRSAGLVVLGGLPGSGKTTIATALARRTGAAHVRVDTIEQAVVDSGLAAHPVGPAGYVVAYAVAGDQLALGHPVVADSVNPLEVTRAAWRSVAERHAAPVLEVEVVCSDAALHQARARTRPSDVEGLMKPRWEQITARDLAAWAADLRVDTATTEVEEAVDRIVAAASWWPGPVDALAAPGAELDRPRPGEILLAGTLPAATWPAGRAVGGSSTGSR